MNYRKNPALSGSELARLLCPIKFKWYRDNPQEPTDAMKLGSLVHMMALEEEKLNDTYICAPEGMRLDPRTKAFQQLSAEARGREIIRFNDWQKAKAMCDSLKSHDLWLNTLALQGVNEKEIFWEENGIQCKGKLDRYLEDSYVIVDLKTTNDASPDKLFWQVKDLGYLLQLAHYQSGIKAITGRDEVPGLLIVAIEKEEPYVCQTYEIPHEMVEEAHTKRKELLEVYRKCKESNEWYGYGEDIIKLERR